MDIINTPIDELVPYINNAKIHPPKQVEMIAASIKEFGFNNPILTDGENGIIAGHGRLEAAKKLGMAKVPVIELAHLSETQKKAYILADNRIAENADWNDELLSLELGGLQEIDFNLDLTGFDGKEIDKILTLDRNNPYTRKVEAPVYEPSGEKPEIEELFNDSKTFDLIEQIKQSSLPQKEKDFLISASGRHTVLNFELIANYYAHSTKECQELMEDNALVIIDFEKAIENGYVSLSDRISEQYLKDYPDEG